MAKTSKPNEFPKVILKSLFWGLSSVFFSSFYGTMPKLESALEKPVIWESAQCNGNHGEMARLQRQGDNRQIDYNPD